AQFSCVSVATNSDLDPAGSVLSARFENPPDTNASGDVLFLGKPQHLPSRLYLYPNGGPNQIIVQGGGLAPNGKTFVKTGAFSRTSLNDAGDLAFVGRMVSAGRGAFVLRAGSGSLQTAGAVGQSSPSGGVFTDVPAVSLINSSGQIAFIGI